jgi:hypothetical protein
MHGPNLLKKGASDLLAIIMSISFGPFILSSHSKPSIDSKKALQKSSNFLPLLSISAIAS